MADHREEFVTIYRSVTYFTVTGLFSAGLYLSLQAYSAITELRQRVIVLEMIVGQQQPASTRK